MECKACQISTSVYYRTLLRLIEKKKNQITKLTNQFMMFSEIRMISGWIILRWKKPKTLQKRF